MSQRKCAVSGSFYPNESSEVIRYIEHFSKDLKSLSAHIKMPKAMIVPHAGYVYSGFTANLAYHFSKHLTPKRLIVIGPSHRVYVKGASITLQENFETPLGSIPIDTRYAKKLQEQFEFLCFDEKSAS